MPPKAEPKIAVELYAGEMLFCDMLDEAYKRDEREVHAFGSRFVLPRERRFRSVESIQDYVNQFNSRRLVWREWPEKAMSIPEVRDRPGPEISAYYRQGRIYMPQSHERRRETTVLHELTHHYSGTNGHGAEFREAYYKILEEAMSPETAFLMRMCIETGMGDRNG